MLDFDFNCNFFLCLGDFDEPKPDEITTLLAVGIFIVKAPANVVQVPNLQYPAINLLKQSLQSHRKIVRLYIFKQRAFKPILTYFLYDY